MKLKEHIFEWLAPKPKKAEFLMDGVTLLGDSIMYGGVAWNLANMGYGKMIHNLSIPGDTAENLWHRLPYELRSTKYVVVEQGTNDVSNGVNPIPYLKKIVQYLKTEGRTVILTGMATRDDHKDIAYTQPMLELALSEGTLYANWPTIVGKTTDGLHPDANMTRDLASCIYKLL